MKWKKNEAQNSEARVEKLADEVRSAAQQSMVFIIDQAERISLMKDEFRSIIREELAAALRQAPVQPVWAEPEGDDGMDDTIMDFLDSFS